MPSVSKTALSGSPQTEKPTHYTYLKEFRTEQCPLFLQHKCTQHRPFTCFHWHFLNQRRRRPIRRRDGTFNYSPDVYCTKYDETTGICPDGDDCPYLHRTTGDTERKYHLRYYKTGTCIHETDARGHCVKNGLHCAFAHGPHDLRPPVYDIRELQAQEALQNGQLGSGEGIPDLQPGVLASQAMIEKILAEDPRWQDTNFVLASYKTEQCTKPPRLCRQGYACPHYHNSRDRRRNPRKFKYRSTPCPSVKHGDEWGEPSKCDSGDSCQYCHSRTEQQFHPEIYKSTKCNDMRQTGYCPRGPFCAFAHVERIPSTEEAMNVVMMQTSCHSKPSPHLYSAGDSEWSSAHTCTHSLGNSSEHGVNAKQLKCLPAENNQKVSEHDNKQSHLSVFSVANPLASSITSSITSSLASSIGSDSSSPTALSSINAKTLPFYPASNTVESVIGSALDLHFSDIRVASLDKELEDPESRELALTSQRLLGSSAPVNIPGSLARSSSLHSSSSLSTSPLSSLSQSFLSSSMAPHHQQQQPPQPLKSEHGVLGTSASSHNSLGLNGVTGSIWDFVTGSFSPSPSPVFTSGTTPSTSTNSNGSELARVRRELDDAKRKIKRWEDSWQQVKQACDAWQKEAQEAKERAKLADTDRQLALLKKEEVESQLKKLQEDFDVVRLSPKLSLGRKYGDIEKLPLPKLHSLQNQLRSELETIDGVIFQLHSKKCVVCQERDRSVVLQPCQHYVLCEHCAPTKPECPYCKTKIMKW
ncbi:putative E3 ubiquitin-protein ligase UNKL isoform X2 [Rhinatrema bivittatum]|uniref:putative E3 ubiquitin-protein ligase UNKL isoform X2 n=1 Tax=Rhinatrema bivittatum TaxID=194408 RepID=UPI00112E5D31|nr:putative E3 ubiquitin-protein ligase UNKL isoform X2 [Rhinatrema bivittatum]